MSRIVYQNSQSTLTLNGYTFRDLMEGASLVLTPVNEATSRANSINGGVSINARTDAGVHDLTIVVQCHSLDDSFLNDAVNSAYPVVFDGSMKRAYIEEGTTKRATTDLFGGSITTKTTKTDNNQDSEVSRTYVIQFRNAVETF